MKARITSDELDFRSALILYLVSNDFHPVEHSGVIFVMGILVRGMECGEKARSWHFYMHHILIGVKGCNSWRAASYFLHHWSVKIRFYSDIRKEKDRAQEELLVKAVLGNMECQQLPLWAGLSEVLQTLYPGDGMELGRLMEKLNQPQKKGEGNLRQNWPEIIFISSFACEVMWSSVDILVEFYSPSKFTWLSRALGRSLTLAWPSKFPKAQKIQPRLSTKTEQFLPYPGHPKWKILSQNPHYTPGKVKIHVPAVGMVWSQILKWKSLFLMMGTDRTATDSVWTREKKREKSSCDDHLQLWWESMTRSHPLPDVSPKHIISS